MLRVPSPEPELGQRPAAAAECGGSDTVPVHASPVPPPQHTWCGGRKSQCPTEEPSGHGEAPRPRRTAAGLKYAHTVFDIRFEGWNLTPLSVAGHGGWLETRGLHRPGGGVTAQDRGVWVREGTRASSSVSWLVERLANTA